MKIITSSLIVIVLSAVFLVFVSSAEAKLLPRFRGSSVSSGKPVARSYSTVVVSPRFLAGRSGIRVSFYGLNNATKVSYMLTYEANGEPQGVQGTISSSEGSSTSRDMYFGTCSSGNCVKRMGVSSAKLEITSNLKSGKTSIKRYRIRL